VKVLFPSTRRKTGYYETEPLPGVAVLSDRVLELARGKR